MIDRKNNEEPLDAKSPEKTLLDLLDSFDIGYMCEDIEGRILEINDYLLKISGLTRAEAVGRLQAEYPNPAVRDVFVTGEALVKRILESGKIIGGKEFFQGEYIIPTTAGEKIPALAHQCLNRDKDGNPVSITSLFMDLRSQKKIQAELEQERRKLEAILFGIGECVTIFDLEGNLLMSNPRGMQIRGNRQTPLLPLEPGSQKGLTLKADGKRGRFMGQVEAIRDDQGTIFAYAEFLKDISDQVRLREREQELFWIKRKMRHGELKSEIIGISGAMRKVFDLIIRCSETDSSILVLGETGVGKELVTRAIHSQSSRKSKPFVVVNCGALPEALLESELFGHLKGAFTGAISERLGLFREAEGGTLFLDEVGDLSVPLQVKLLRALQEKEVRPVGGDRSYRVDVRVITATNRDLKELIGQNAFRKDLYYRIAVIPLLIPPLRDRREDILPLAEHFIKKYRKKLKDGATGLDHSAQQVLLEYWWPGNIRELENAIEHGLAMARGKLLTSEDLPVQVVVDRQPATAERHPRKEEPAGVGLPPRSLKDAEIDAIANALLRHGGNRTLAAKELGICRTTLWKKMKSIAVSQKDVPHLETSI